MKKIIVAIDGYSSCGKSTIAKALARYAGYMYVDTGAMYRAVALYMLRHGIREEQAIVDALADKLQASTAAVFVDYKGITVADDTKLRKERSYVWNF